MLIFFATEASFKVHLSRRLDMSAYSSIPMLRRTSSLLCVGVAKLNMEQSKEVGRHFDVKQNGPVHMCNDQKYRYAYIIH